MMKTLRLKLLHRWSPQTFSTSFDLYSLRGRLPAGASVDFGRHQKLVAQARADALGEPFRRVARGELDDDRQRRLLPDAFGFRADHEDAG